MMWTTKWGSQVGYSFDKTIPVLFCDSQFYLQHIFSPFSRRTHPLRYDYPSTIGTTFRLSVDRRIPNETTSPKIMIFVVENVVLENTKETVRAGWNENSLLSTSLLNTSIGLYKLRSPKFPSVAEHSIPFNIHSDCANQSKSNVNDGTVNNHQFKPSWTHNGIRHSDPLHVP
jgi:hypothetical protein